MKTPLEASESARKLAVEETVEARHAADAMRERLEAALARVRELEAGIESVMGTIHEDSQYHQQLEALLAKDHSDA